MRKAQRNGTAYHVHELKESILLKYIYSTIFSSPVRLVGYTSVDSILGFLFCSVHLLFLFMYPYQIILINTVWRCGIVIPWTLFCKIALALSRLLCLQMNFHFFFSIYDKSVMGILIRIPLGLHITSDNVDILMMLIPIGNMVNFSFF